MKAEIQLLSVNGDVDECRQEKWASTQNFGNNNFQWALGSNTMNLTRHLMSKIV